MESRRVYVIPCSGIGKASASVGREATYRLVEELMPESCGTLCLALLTLEDEEARAKVCDNFVVAIDGCAKDCSRINIEASGKTPEISRRVQDYMKKHKGLKPGAVLDTGEGGRKLAKIMSEELAGEIKSLLDRGA